MTLPIPLRPDYDADSVRRLAKASKDADQTRRLLALAAIYEGSSRGAAASIGGVTQQIVRDWVLRFNEGGPGGLIDAKRPGRPPKLGDDHRRALIEIVERGPYPCVDGVVRWRLADLAAWLHGEFGITLSEQTVSRELKAAGYRRLTARPQHPKQNEWAMADFKKTSPPSSKPSPGASKRVRP